MAAQCDHLEYGGGLRPGMMEVDTFHSHSVYGIADGIASAEAVLTMPMCQRCGFRARKDIAGAYRCSYCDTD